MQRTVNYIGYFLANALALFAIFYVLFFAHVYLNGLVIPDNLRQAEGRVKADLTQWYIVALLILGVELIGLLYGLYRFNVWYIGSPLSQSGSTLAVVTTGIVGLFIIFGVLFFLLG